MKLECVNGQSEGDGADCSSGSCLLMRSEMLPRTPGAHASSTPDVVPTHGGRRKPASPDGVRVPSARSAGAVLRAPGDGQRGRLDGRRLLAGLLQGRLQGRLPTGAHTRHFPMLPSRK